RRMRREFDAQARIGRHGRTGLARVAFTPEYNAVRRLVAGWMQRAGLRTRIDAVGNLFGRKQGASPDLPVVMTGSHLDTQRPGGRFDGIAGGLAGPGGGGGSTGLPGSWRGWRRCARLPPAAPGTTIRSRWSPSSARSRAAG